MPRRSFIAEVYLEFFELRSSVLVLLGELWDLYIHKCVPF